MIKSAEANRKTTKNVKDKKIQEERASIEIAIDNSVKSGEYCCSVPLVYDANLRHLEDLGYLVTVVGVLGINKCEISWYK